MKRKEFIIPKDPSLLPTEGQIQAPSYFKEPGELPTDPDAYVRKPVTSAHAIELTIDPSGKLDMSHNPVMLGSLCKQDTVAINAGGDGVEHGRFGQLSLDQVRGIPLEYLSLLSKASEGVAAVNTLKKDGGGTLLVYGATNPAAMAAVQVATSNGMASVAVVGGEHSGNAEAVDLVKGFASYPGTAVTEEYAMKKSMFRDLVKAVSDGENDEPVNADELVADFRSNLKEYCDVFEEDLNGLKLTDEDLSKFSAEQYAMLKQKFKIRGNELLRGDTSGPSFEPPTVVSDMIRSPSSESIESYPMLKQQESADQDSPFVPYDFSVLETKSMPGVDSHSGGPICGAIIAATPALQVACKAVADAAKDGKRAQAEALQYLTGRQKNAYAAASSVANLARAAGSEVIVVDGSLPGLGTVQVSPEDVSSALDAMRIDSSGSSKINFFIQVYRACDFQSYEDYAIHKATEPLSGPRVKVVTK